MPFLDHLEELRWRIIYSLIGIVVGVAGGLFCVFKFDLIRLLSAPVTPYLPPGQHLVILGPMDAFSIHIQLAFVLGSVIAAPVVGYQIWAFMSPALHKPERKVILPVIFAGDMLFIIGASLAWFIVLPMSLKWLHSLGTSLTPMYSAAAYFGFATNLALAFGVAFEMPLLLVALSALGIVTAKTLGKSRKFAILFIWAGSAIISPGDAITVTIALAVPLYLLYELSIVIAFVIERKKLARKAREELAAT